MAVWSKASQCHKMFCYDCKVMDPGWVELGRCIDRVILPKSEFNKKKSECKVRKVQFIYCHPPQLRPATPYII